jgi:hypothetical protein
LRVPRAARAYRCEMMPFHRDSRGVGDLNDDRKITPKRDAVDAVTPSYPTWHPGGFFVLLRRV